MGGLGSWGVGRFLIRPLSANSRLTALRLVLSRSCYRVFRPLRLLTCCAYVHFGSVLGTTRVLHASPTFLPAFRERGPPVVDPWCILHGVRPTP